MPHGENRSFKIISLNLVSIYDRTLRFLSRTRPFFFFLFYLFYRTHIVSERDVVCDEIINASARVRTRRRFNAVLVPWHSLARTVGRCFQGLRNRQIIIIISQYIYVRFIYTTAHLVEENLRDAQPETCVLRVWLIRHVRERSPSYIWTKSSLLSLFPRATILYLVSVFRRDTRFLRASSWATCFFYAAPMVDSRSKTDLFLKDRPRAWFEIAPTSLVCDIARYIPLSWPQKISIET